MDSRRLIEGLIGIEWVKGAAVMLEDGTLVESSGVDRSDTALMAFGGVTSSEVATSLGMGEARSITINTDGRRILIVYDSDIIVGVLMGPYASIDRVRDVIMGVMG